MNQDQVLSSMRWLATVACGYAVGRGWITADQTTYIIAAALALVPLVFSFLKHTDSAKLAAVEALPDVKEIVTKPTATDGVAAATADPSRPKVVPQ